MLPKPVLLQVGTRLVVQLRLLQVFNRDAVHVNHGPDPVRRGISLNHDFLAWAGVRLQREARTNAPSRPLRKQRIQRRLCRIFWVDPQLSGAPVLGAAPESPPRCS